MHMIERNSIPSTNSHRRWRFGKSWPGTRLRRPEGPDQHCRGAHEYIAHQNSPEPIASPRSNRIGIRQ